MPRAGFEPAIPMFKWPKIVLALDCAAIETGTTDKQNSELIIKTKCLTFVQILSPNLILM
jgi:hypothetical protein